MGVIWNKTQTTDYTGISVNNHEFVIRKILRS